MKQYIIKKLRELSQIKGKQRTWVSECNNDQLWELFQRIKNGESAKSIAQTVQKKWKINTHSSIHSISQGILKFKRRIIELIERDVPGERVRSIATKAKETMPKLGSVEAIDLIARLQQERIIRMMKEERDLGLRHGNLSKDLQALASVSKVVLKEKEFAIKHENNDPIKRHELEKRNQAIEKAFNALMENTTEEQKQNLVEGIKKAEKKLLEIQEIWPRIVDSEGRTILISPEDAHKYEGVIYPNSERIHT